MSTSKDGSIRPQASYRIPQGVDVIATAPARIDLAGGWTDTPPICFEHGARVVNMAVSINGQHPFMVRGRRTARLSIVLPHGDPCEHHEFSTFEELEDHQDPMAPCSLLKACIIASGILEDNTDSDNNNDNEHQELRNQGDRENLTCPSSTLPSLRVCMTHNLREQPALEVTLEQRDLDTVPMTTTTTTTTPLPSPPSSLFDVETLEIKSRRRPPKRASATLVDVLARTGGGIEMDMTSSLPVGSGMGTSSILAAAALAVLSTLRHGRGNHANGDEDGAAAAAVAITDNAAVMVPTDVLLARTLEVEQRMGTGGGWQDQVGGVLPGLKVGWMHEPDRGLQVQGSMLGCSSARALFTRPLALAEGTMEDLDRRLVLIYTGQTRLAKNLLQTVLHRWGTRDDSVVQTMRHLVEDAALCESKLEDGDLRSVGEIMTRYFEYKRFLSGTRLDQPPVVAALTRLLGPFMDGSVLAGAGGGGFLAVLLRQGVERAAVVQQVREQLRNEAAELGLTAEMECGMWAWEAQIDRLGLCVRVQDGNDGRGHSIT